VKIGQHRVDGAEAVAGRDEDRGFAGKWPDRAIRGGGFEQAQRGRADRNDASAGAAPANQR